MSLIADMAGAVVRADRWADHDAAVAAALAKLHELLRLAFAADGWPRRLTLPAPHTPAEVEALDTFITALRTDLPDVTVLVRDQQPSIKMPVNVRSSA